MTSKPIAYSYIRFSTRAQSKGDSLRRQLEASAAYANEHGLTLNTDYRDLGLSGFKGINRVKGALGAFLSGVESGDVPRGSILIVENLDRLTREDIVVALSLFLNVIASGITVVTLMDRQTYSRETVNANPMLLLVSITILARGNGESRTKAERLAANWSQKGKLIEAGTGQKWTSVVPFWLKLKGVDRHERLKAPWTPLEDRIALVQRIFHLALSMGSEAITRLLNEEGAPAPKRRDGWHASTVKLILGDRRVLGEFQRYSKARGETRRAVGEPVIGYFPQIIAPEVFYAVQKAIADRRCGGGGQKGKRPNIFTGLTRCECGRPMEYRDKGYERGRFLICSGYHRRQGCDNSHRFGYAELETSMLDFVTDVQIPDAVAHKATVAGLKLTGKQAERADVQARIEKVRRDLEEEDDAEERAALKARRNLLKDRRSALNAEIATLQVEANTGKRSAIDDRRAALRQLREKIGSLQGAELFEARSMLASALKGVIDFISFDNDGEAIAVLAGGLKAYRFRGNTLIDAFDHTDGELWPRAKPWGSAESQPPSSSRGLATLSSG